MTSGAPSNEWTGRKFLPIRGLLVEQFDEPSGDTGELRHDRVHKPGRLIAAHPLDREVRAFSLKLEPPAVPQWDGPAIMRALFDEVKP